MSNDAPLSGTPLTITAAGYTADIASVGASLRALRHVGAAAEAGAGAGAGAGGSVGVDGSGGGARDLVVPFDADEVRPVFRGAVLAPWPNRVVDGRYTFAGVDNELALTEPARAHALHGLVAWTDFRVEVHEPDRAVLATTIPAQNGYPHRIDVRVEYRLDADGLHTTVTGTNTGSTPAPWGTGPHPYLTAGDAVAPGSVDAWTLTLPADAVLEVTEDRLVPTGLVPVGAVDGGVFDLRTPTTIGARFIDHAFTGFHRDAAGVARIDLVGPDGRGVRMAFGAECGWAQVHTADHVVPEWNRIGLAVEPMTCAPDAFNAGETRGLIVLDPGASHPASWTISAI
jgi:aldose 1-epimerase